jgi:outer membrane protein OmpA-like peptidoglycan-associated protein
MVVNYKIFSLVIILSSGTVVMAGEAEEKLFQHLFPQTQSKPSTTINSINQKGLPFDIFNSNVLKKEFTVTDTLKMLSNNNEGLVISNIEGNYWEYEYELSKMSRSNFIQQVKSFLKTEKGTVLYQGDDYLFFKLYKNRDLYWAKVVHYPEKYTIKIVKEKSLELPKANVNTILKRLEFDSGKATIKEGSKGEILRIIDTLNKYPKQRFEIQGHTDSQGKAKLNQELSQKRAEAVRNALIKANINPDRLIAKGYGSTRPIASNDTKEGRQKNRRVELKSL